MVMCIWLFGLSGFSRVGLCIVNIMVMGGIFRLGILLCFSVILFVWVFM